MVSFLLYTLPIIVLIIAIYYLPKYYVDILPENNPVNHLERYPAGSPSDKTVICFVGDSITHGRYNLNYTRLVEERLNMEDCIYINAGINGHTTADILGRIEGIVKCQPDIITILIGTNDINGSIDDNYKSYVERSEYIPDDPQFWTKPRFRRDLEEIVTTFQSQTDAKIAVLSLPILTEVPESEGFVKSMEYSKIIKTVAETQNITYLPLNERMAGYIENHPSNSPKREWSLLLERKMLIQRYILRRDWDNIASSNGLQLLVDNIHVNRKGAAMIVDLVEPFVRENLPIT